MPKWILLQLHLLRMRFRKIQDWHQYGNLLYYLVYLRYWPLCHQYT